MPARNPVLADHVEERKTTIVMTKEERLAALKALLEGLREPLVYVDGDIAERTESWGVKAIPSVPGWMIKDLCLCVPGCEYNLVKSNDGVDCCLVLQSEKGNNNFQAAHHTRVRAIRWAQAEIAKLEQPAPVKAASALPYKILLKSMDSRMGYDEEEKFHWMLINTSPNDSRMLFHDIGTELTESTGAILRIVDMDSLYMIFEAKFHSEARAIEWQAVRWLNKRISEIEQSAIDPKEVIEAAAADGSAMDAAESLLDREQMRREVVDSINKSPFQLTTALNHLFKALDAGYAKDEEIARLTKLNDGCVDWIRENRVVESHNKMHAEVQSLSKVIELMQAEKESLQGEIAASAHIIDEKDEEIAAFKKEINKLKGEAINQEAIINTLKYKIEQQAKEGAQPRTRTAADAKIGDPVWFHVTPPQDKVLRGHIEAVGDDASWGRFPSSAAYMDNCDFGTKWGFIEEEAK